MALSSHVQPIQPRVLGIYLAGAMAILGFLLVCPFLVSIVAQEYLYSLIFGSLMAAFLGTGGSIWNLSGPAPGMDLTDAIVITAAVYLVFSILGAIPLLPLTSFVNALFEAMSGFTTTGLTIFDESTLPITILFYRGYMQWVGGMGIIVLSLAILLRPGKAAFKLYTAEFGEENIFGSVITTAKVVIKVYLALTVLGYLAYLAAGMGFFDGLVHILTTIPTGGFSVYPESIGYYQSPAISMTVSLFMLLGAISFPLYYISLQNGLGHFFKDNQVRGLLAITLIASLIFFVSLGPGLNSLVPGIFQTVTSITTTGYNTIPNEPLSEANKLVTIALMIIGGGTGSTAGGIKVFRLLVLIAFVRVMFLRAILPREAKIPLGFIEGLEVTVGEAESIAAFFVAYLGVMFFSTLGVMWIDGFGLTNALFEVASAEGTVGLSVGVTSPQLSWGSKLILTLNMWLGRLEIIPVLVAMYPPIWFKLRDRNSSTK